MIVAEPDPSRARKLLVRLTRDGAEARAENDARLADVEREWEMRYCRSVVSTLRGALERVHDGLEPSVPDFLLVLFSGGIGFRVEPQPGAV